MRLIAQFTGCAHFLQERSAMCVGTGGCGGEEVGALCPSAC